MTTKKPAKPRAKKLTLAAVQKEYNALQKMTPFIWDESDNTIIKYYEVFDVNIMSTLFEAVLEGVKYTEENGIDTFKGELGDLQLQQYIQFLIIKFYTELGNEIPDTFPEQINIMSQFIALGHWDRIFNEMLSPHQVERVLGKYEELISRGNQYNEMLQKELEKVERLTVNKDVIHPLVNPTNTTSTDTIDSESVSNA